MKKTNKKITALCMPVATRPLPQSNEQGPTGRLLEAITASIVSFNKDMRGQRIRRGLAAKKAKKGPVR